MIVGSNHFRGFLLDLIPSFTMGVGEVIASGESGTPKGPQKTDPVFANSWRPTWWSPARRSRSRRGCRSTTGSPTRSSTCLDGLDVPVVPAGRQRVRPAAADAASGARSSAAAGRRDRGDADGRQVAVIASGGLSHQLPWPSDWADPQDDDEEFMVDAWLNGRGEWERFDKRRREIIVAAQPCIFEDFDKRSSPTSSRAISRSTCSCRPAELEEIAGNGGQELRTWLVMAAAIGFAPGSSAVLLADARVADRHGNRRHRPESRPSTGGNTHDDHSTIAAHLAGRRAGPGEPVRRRRRRQRSTTTTSAPGRHDLPARRRPGLHRAGATSARWRRTSRQTDAACCVDLLQYGKSDKCRISGPMWDFHAAKTVALMDALGIDRPTSSATPGAAPSRSPSRPTTRTGCGRW